MNPIKINISAEVAAFNDAVQEADTLTDFQFDRESALSLLDRMQQTRIYPYSARALAEAIAGLNIKRNDIAAKSCADAMIAHMKKH